MSLPNFMDGLEVGEDFLAQAAASIPTSTEFNRRYVHEINNAFFRQAPDKYLAKIENPSGGQINQMIWEGRNANTGKDSEYPPAFTIGANWNRTPESDSITSERVVNSEGHVAFYGTTGYGKIVKALYEKWGVTAENEDYFKHVNQDTNEEFMVGPEAQRFIRWYAKRHKQYPDFAFAPVWNGVFIQMDKEVYTGRDGKERDQSVPVGVAKLEGETQAEFDWYLELLKATGSERPWYVLGPNDDPLNSAQSAPETKAAAADTKTTTSTSNGAAAGAKAKRPAEEILGDLITLANQDGITAGAFKTQAMVLVKPYPKWISHVAKSEYFEACKAGSAEVPAGVA